MIPVVALQIAALADAGVAPAATGLPGALGIAPAALLLLFPALMAYAAASDLLTMTIPNRISVALVAGFAFLALWVGLGPWQWLGHCAAGAATLVVTFLFFAFGWMGGGDAKLAAATALWFGLEGLGDYVVTASIVGGLLTLALLVARRVALPGFMLHWPWAVRLHDRRTGIPYGIALAAAALVVLPGSALWTTLLGA